MDNTDLLFYDEYEQFYAMADTSAAFRSFCKEAFGQDLSQDGFSDIAQIDMILPHIPDKKDVRILDIGCGNGKMLGYLQRKTSAFIHGFDYSEKAIAAAKAKFAENAEFKVGIIGETEYPKEYFDVVISMDTMYFCKDMNELVAQIRSWLKKDGVLFVGYQEGDVIPRTENAYTTKLAKAAGSRFEATDITRETYELLKKKRNAALKYQREFEAEGNKQWFDMLMQQTQCSEYPFEQFSENMARYIYLIRK